MYCTFRQMCNYSSCHFLPQVRIGDIAVWDALFLGILHCLPCAAIFAADAENDQVGTVCHFPVSDLVGPFVVCRRRIAADLNFVIVFPKGWLIVPKFCCFIGHHPYMRTVVGTDCSFASANHRGHKLVKVPVTAYQELHIGMARQQLADQRFQPPLYR